MSSIGDVFNRCRAENRAALIPYLTAGFPSQKSFVSLLRSIAGVGADIIEIGIPFSDPLADGPTIQYSSQRALENGVTVDRTLQTLSRLETGSLPPLVIMSYLNPLLQYGLKKFARNAHKSGVRGLIVPDIIPEESADVEQACRTEGIDVIHLLAPTSTPDRQGMILRRSRGFVYLVSVTGVTGARRQLPRELNRWIADVKSRSPVPTAVGFGIARPEQAQHVAKVADGVIVGSAIIDILRNGSNPAGAVSSACKFVRQLKLAMYR
ncbi:MAG: tryptophan synthase subunit alpha [Candidatus Zixiibacteriota bacterium]